MKSVILYSTIYTWKATILQRFGCSSISVWNWGKSKDSWNSCKIYFYNQEGMLREGKIFFIRLLYQTILNMHQHSGTFENSCIFKITQSGLASRLVKEGGCRVISSSVSFSKRCLGRCKSDENQKIPGLSRECVRRVRRISLPAHINPHR